MRFAFIAAEKAQHTVTDPVPVSAVSRAAGSTPGGAAGIGAGAGRSSVDGAGAGVVRREPGSATAVRAFIEGLGEQQEAVSRKRVIRLMQEDGLHARARKRFKGTTISDHDQPGRGQSCSIAQFTAAAPNQRWVGDTTEFVDRRERQAVSRRHSRLCSRGSSSAGRSAR